MHFLQNTDGIAIAVMLIGEIILDFDRGILVKNQFSGYRL